MKLLNVGTRARFAGAPERTGFVTGYATVQRFEGGVPGTSFVTDILYVLDLGDQGFYSPGRDTYVTLLLVSENNIEVL